MTWTKFSERLPEEGVSEVFLSRSDMRSVETSMKPRADTWQQYAEFMRDVPDLRWHPITYPEAPKEETQKEKDEAIMRVAWSNSGNQTRTEWAWFADGFFSALRYERAEVAKLLSNSKPMAGSFNLIHHESMVQLRRRFGLDK